MKFLKVLSAMFIASGMMAACGNSNPETGSPEETPKDPASANAVIENIMTRASIRQFTDQQISKDTLDLLVKAGMAAPSAMNKQPWAFVVVTEREMLDSLMTVKEHANLETATAAIVVCGDMDKAIEGAGREYWVQDCSAVTENILLAAHAYGLGAVWCGVYPIDETVQGVSRVLSLPETIVPLDIITLGYPDEDPAPKDKYKPELIHYNKW